MFVNLFIYRPPLSKELWFSEDPEVGKKLVFKDVST
jgi:programmed cell death 8 (apoptosis-inducing factor)